LTPIERVLVLQEVPIFARVTADQLLALANITHQMPVTAGSPLFGEADRPAIYTLLSGEVRLERPDRGGTTTLLAGDTAGVYETLGGERTGSRAQVIQPGAVLRIDREELFDLLADHTALLQGLFSAMLRARAPQEALKV
jgi:CRP-like cAMP-binding protein